MSLAARRAMDRLLVVIAAILIWQLVYVASDGVGVSSPLSTFLFTVDLFGKKFWWQHVDITIRELFYSLAIAYIGGIVIGVALGSFAFAGRVIEPLIVALSAVPKVALYPVLLLAFGLGISAKVAFGALHGIIPVTLFALNAVRNINPVHLKTARVAGLSRVQTARRIMLPATIPMIFTGLRLGFALTLLGVIMGEMFASQRGVGYMIMNGINIADVPTMTAVIMVVTVFALVTNSILLYFDRRLRPP